LDLTAFYDLIRARQGRPGRDPVDPRILLALWLLATIEGIGSARKLSDLCQRDMAYMWICGGVGVNHHLLSDFRTAQVELLDRLLTDSVATLLHQGLVSLERVAQDGMRVRASAGGSSFRRRKTLRKCRDEARRQIEALQEEQAADPAAGDRRSTAARQRAARERAERVEKALKELAEVEEKMERREKGSSKDARVSTTDPEARRMKMANGGFDPADNVQFATDADARIIVGVDVTNEGTDGGQMPPMHEKVKSDYGKTPDKMLVDSAYATKEAVTSVEAAGTEVVSTVPRAEQLEKHGKDPHARQKGDSDEYANFRERMSQEEYKDLYKTRPSVAEFPNADCRNRNLRQFGVRGLEKVKAVTLWHVLAFNFMRMLNLGVLQT